MDSCIQNFHLGGVYHWIFIGNLVLLQHMSEAVKWDFQPYIHRYTSPKENFKYGYPHPNELLRLF